MKKEIKGFVLGCIVTSIVTGITFGAMTKVDNVFLSPFSIKLDGEKYSNSMPVLNYQGRTYLALRELGEVLGNEVDFKNDTVIINTNSNKSISEEIPKLDNVSNIIKNTYYGEYSQKKLEEGAIKGMVNSLGDKYSVYMNKQEYDTLMTDTTGNYTGIGLYLTTDSNKNLIQVISPIKGSPASKVDIKPEDYILEVDGKAFTGDELNQATQKIKEGKEGSLVELTIQRDNKKFKVKVERKLIELYKLEYEMLDKNIGYINIKHFDSNTYSDFYEAYMSLIKNGANGIIIDLRDNPGGLLNQVLNVCNILIPKGNNIIYTVDKNGNKQEYVSISEYVNIPTVVLVNEGSASASEIMASCLQDNKIAKIVGTNTFGKGVVQSIYSMSDGTGLKLTVKEYFRANGNKINGIGVIPDYIIQNDENANEDLQFKKAIELLK